MTKLDESTIIKIFQSKLENKKFVSEDVETFRIGNTNVILKVDTLVQSTDIPPKMDLSDAARKSIVACVSDFASKGVRPEFGIISINLPKEISRSKINKIAQGIADSSKEFQIKILGGDTNEGKEIVFHVCIFGKSKKIIPRRGAKIGDSIFVTGIFGNTSAGLKILLYKKNGKKSFLKKAINSVIKPKPRLEFGLKACNYFSSSMDSSDGLSTTLNEMAKQSNKKFIIDKVPAQKDLYEFAKQNKLEPMNLIFHGGEEYEFVFTVSKKNESRIQKIASQLKVPIIKIGHVTKGSGVYQKSDEKLLQIKDLGWHHFNHSPKPR